MVLDVEIVQSEDQIPVSALQRVDPARQGDVLLPNDKDLHLN